MHDSNKHTDHPLASNIRRYFLYTALKGIGFGLFVAMWLIYLQQRRGLTLTEATMVDVTFWIAATLGEVPTGVVADTFGRKASLAIGTALIGTSVFAWVYAPTLPLVILAYASMALGNTFLSGAEDALFFESVQRSGRGDDYTRLVGRAGATFLGAMALGSVASGLLAGIDLIVPFLVSAVSLLITFGVVLTFKESYTKEESSGAERRSYTQILRRALSLMRTRPALRYPMLYLALVPLAAIVMETFFLQPQAVALGVPLAGVGVMVMLTQVSNIAGETWSHRIRRRIGEQRLIYSAPALIVFSLILLALLQIFPALVFIAAISFITSVLRPIVLNRIQNEASDDVRATVLSVQSLMFTFILTIGEPILGFIADQSGLPSAYIGLAGGLGILSVFLFWTSRNHFPRATISVSQYQTSMER